MDRGVQFLRQMLGDDETLGDEDGEPIVGEELRVTEADSELLLDDDPEADGVTDGVIVGRAQRGRVPFARHSFMFVCHSVDAGM